MIDFEELDKNYQAIYDSDGFGRITLELKEFSIFDNLTNTDNLHKLTLREACELCKTKSIPVTNSMPKGTPFYEEMSKICNELNH